MYYLSEDGPSAPQEPRLGSSRDQERRGTRHNDTDPTSDIEVQVSFRSEKAHERRLGTLYITGWRSRSLQTSG